MLTLEMLVDFILVCSVQFSTFLNVPELWRACLYNHNSLFFETRLWNSNLNGPNIAEFSHVFSKGNGSREVMWYFRVKWNDCKVTISWDERLIKQYWDRVLLTFMVFNSEPIMKIKSLSWMNSISFLRNSNCMTHPFCSISTFSSQDPKYDRTGTIAIIEIYDLEYVKYFCDFHNKHTFGWSSKEQDNDR